MKFSTSVIFFQMKDLNILTHYDGQYLKTVFSTYKCEYMMQSDLLYQINHLSNLNYKI